MELNFADCFMCVGVYAVYVAVSVGVCTCGCLCIRAHAGGDDSNIGCLSSTVLHLYFFEMKSLVEPELIDSVRLAGQWASGIPPSLPQFQPGMLFRFLHLGAGDPTQVLMLDRN